MLAEAGSPHVGDSKPSASLGWWLTREAWTTLRVPSYNAARLRGLTDRRLRTVLSAATASELYRDLLRDAGPLLHGGGLEAAIDVLRGLPPATKGFLREAGAGALVGGRVRPEWRSSWSSGSTGEPFLVYFDPRAWAVGKYLLKWRARSLAGVRFWVRIAVLDAVPTTFRSPNWAARSGRLAVVSVLQPTEDLLAELRAFGPTVLHGPPSALNELVDLAPRGHGAKRLRQVFTSGELLQPSVRARIQETWDCSVVDIYGTSETKEIAFECAHGALHLNEDTVFVEVLDDHGAPVPHGTEGEIAVTSLLNVAMPTLRYRPGDRGVLQPAGCPCGLPFRRLSPVTGRTVDVVELEDGTRLSPYALTMAIEPLPGLKRFKILQTGRRRLHVKAVPIQESEGRQLARGLERALHEVTHGLVTTTVELVPELRRDPDRKFRVVERAWGPDPA